MSRSWLIVLAALLVAVPAFVFAGAAGMLGGGPPDSTVVRSAREALRSGAADPGRQNGDDARLETFYGDSSAAPLWVDGGGPSRAAGDFMEELEAVSREGLDPETFNLGAVRRAFEQLADDPASAGRTELLVSGAFLRLADALIRGSEPTGEGEVAWELERDPAPGPDLLERIRAGESPADILAELRPTLAWYDRFIGALARYRAAMEEGGWPTVSAGEALEPGDTAQRVAEVRARLQAGHDEAEAELASRHAGPPDLYDEGLVRAVERFQERHGIVQDGIVGPETLAAMNAGLDERIEDLRINLDRLRRMPRSLGERAIVVNVAGFELLVLEHDRPVMTMAVVVGKPENRTHVFGTDLEYLVFNPYWMVPASIVRNEIAPALRDDPSHLTANRFRVVPADDPYGAPAPEHQVDWSEAGSEAWPWTVRQDPGESNALGRVKFMFPNEYDIYLHDTPADHLFERSFRAFSHGCIRLERPFDLARYVLRVATDRPAADVEALVASGERVTVDLDRPIPVYITYLTAWVDEDGTVRFHHDLYHLDERESIDEGGAGAGEAVAGERAATAATP